MRCGVGRGREGGVSLKSATEGACPAEILTRVGLYKAEPTYKTLCGFKTRLHLPAGYVSLCNGDGLYGTVELDLAAAGFLVVNEHQRSLPPKLFLPHAPAAANTHTAVNMGA